MSMSSKSSVVLSQKTRIYKGIKIHASTQEFNLSIYRQICHGIKTKQLQLVVPAPEFENQAAILFSSHVLFIVAFRIILALLKQFLDH